MPSALLRAAAAGAAFAIATALLLSPALAQNYPNPYAGIATEAGAPPNVVTTPAGVLGLYDKGYAARAARFLNQMAAAANNCNGNAYNEARKAYTDLIVTAQANYDAAHARYLALRDQALTYWSHSRTGANFLVYGLSFGLLDPVTQLPEPLRTKLSNAEKAQAAALSDLNALRNFPLPQYRCDPRRYDYYYNGQYSFDYGSYDAYYWSSSAHPFVGINVSGGFQNTNFSLSDTGFNVNGSGVMGGGFAGVLLPVPNTNTQFGFRVGGEGGSVTGDIRMPAASPMFTYRVKTDGTLYQEAMVSVAAPEITSFLLNVAYDVPLAPRWNFSLGVAESHTSVNGTAGAFSVTDGGWRPGMTFTVGGEWPVARLPNGVVDLFAQYRGVLWNSTVNIPGAVPLGSYTSEISGGVMVHFGGGVSWTLRN